MRVLAIGKLTGGIRQHVLSLQKNSKNEYVLLSYGTSENESHNTPVLDIFGLRALSFAFFGPVCAVNLIVRKKADAIHAHYILPAGLVGAIASIISGKKLYITAHGTDVYETRWLGFLKKWVCGRAEKTICVSHSLERELKNMGVDNTTTIYNGAEPEIGKAKKIRIKKPAILFAGALTKNKAGMLNGIIKATKGRNPEITFYVAGEGKVKIEGAKMLGKIPPKKLCQYYKSADALVSCSEYEGFSLVILEAQMAGLPVIARKNSGQEELVSEDRGLLAETPTEFAIQIRRVLKDKKLRDRIVYRAGKFAQHHTWKRAAEETDKVYLEKNGRKV